VSGNPIAFTAAALVIVVWAATGPLFAYSDTWQLTVNTGTEELEESDLNLMRKDYEALAEKARASRRQPR
jgi:hypothetical protein